MKTATRALLVSVLLAVSSVAYSYTPGFPYFILGEVLDEMPTAAPERRYACYRVVTDDTGYTKVKFVERLPGCKAPLMRLDAAKAWAEALNAGRRTSGVSATGFGFTVTKAVKFGPPCNAKSKLDAARGMLSDTDLRLLDRNCKNKPRRVKIPAKRVVHN